MNTYSLEDLWNIKTNYDIYVTGGLLLSFFYIVNNYVKTKSKVLISSFKHRDKLS